VGIPFLSERSGADGNWCRTKHSGLISPGQSFCATKKENAHIFSIEKKFIPYFLNNHTRLITPKQRELVFAGRVSIALAQARTGHSSSAAESVNNFNTFKNILNQQKLGHCFSIPSPKKNQLRKNGLARSCTAGKEKIVKEQRRIAPKHVNLCQKPPSQT